MKKIINNELIKSKDDYLFNLLGVDNFNKESSHLRHFYNHLIKNEKKIKGNIFEFGCYRGKTLLSIALLLKKLKSKKIIYAFDNFKGFPRYHEFDKFKYLKKYKSVYRKHLISKAIRSFIIKKKITQKNISSSEEFQKNPKKELFDKIKFLNLKNIKIIEGDFNSTVKNFFKNYSDKIFSVNLDSDLYESYNLVLPLVYEKLSLGGYIHLDEYYSLKFPGCKIAVDEFCKKNNVRVTKNTNYEWEFKRFCILKKKT